MSVFNNQNNGLQQLALLKSLKDSKSGATASGVAALNNSARADETALNSLISTFAEGVKGSKHSADTISAADTFIEQASNLPNANIAEINDLAWRETNGLRGAPTQKRAMDILTKQSTSPDKAGTATSLMDSKDVTGGMKALLGTAKKLGFGSSGAEAMLEKGMEGREQKPYSEVVRDLSKEAWAKAPAHEKAGFGSAADYAANVFRTQTTGQIGAAVVNTVLPNADLVTAAGQTRAIGQIDSLIDESVRRNPLAEKADVTELRTRLHKMVNDTAAGRESKDADFIKNMQYGSQFIYDYIQGGGVAVFGDKMAGLTQMEMQNLPMFRSAISNWGGDLRGGLSVAQASERAVAGLRMQFPESRDYGELPRDSVGNVVPWDKADTPQWVKDVVGNLPHVHRAAPNGRGDYVFYMEDENRQLVEVLMDQRYASETYGDWFQGMDWLKQGVRSSAGKPEVLGLTPAGESDQREYIDWLSIGRK